jgi:membrane protease YdiL (CAAX protease family)
MVGLGLALALRLDIAGSLGTGYAGSGARPVLAGLAFGVALLAVAVAADPSILPGATICTAGPRSSVPPLSNTPGGGILLRGPALRTTVLKNSTALTWGLVGAAVLVAFPLALRLNGTTTELPFPAGDFPLWAAVVSLVAVAEEVVLRGVLFAALAEARGIIPAVLLTPVIFALLHIPLYGPGVLPLDLAVGLWLGALRVVSGSVVAPATAHALADVAAWWLA